MSSLLELTNLCGGKLVGDAGRKFIGVCSVDNLCPDKISYVANSAMEKLIVNCSEIAYVVKPSQSHLISLGILHDNPTQAFRLILGHFYSTEQSHVMDDSCIISENSKVGKNITLGCFTVIRENAVLSDNVIIGSHSTIHKDVIIGKNTVIGDHVIINSGVRIGSNCVISDGAVIGSRGFGFSFESGNWMYIPQVGSVSIGNNVHIGVNTCIDRGAINDTVIGNNVIVDNLVHIAHNVTIGDGTAMAACVGIAGSTSIGKNCMLGGQVGVVGHLKIADCVQVNAGAMVLKSIDVPGTYSGSLNALPATKWNRMAVYIKKLESIFKKRK